MFKAKFNRKEESNGLYTFFVDFTNDEETYTESCIPQDVNGFNYWIKSRLDAYNTKHELDALLVSGEEIDPGVLSPKPILSEFEQRKAAWFATNDKLQFFLKLKNTAIETGKEITPERQAEIDTLATYVDENIDRAFFE